MESGAQRYAHLSKAATAIGLEGRFLSKNGSSILPGETLRGFYPPDYQLATDLLKMSVMILVVVVRTAVGSLFIVAMLRLPG